MNPSRVLLPVVALVLLCGIAAYLLLRDETPPSGPDREPVREGTVPSDYEAPGVPPDRPETEGAPESNEASPGETEGAETEGGTAEEADTAEEFSYDRETPYRVSVRVQDADGQSVDCEVEILDRGTGWSFGALPHPEEGVFAGHLPDPGVYIAEANREGTRRRAYFRILDAAPAAEVLIRYEGTGSVSGSVLTAAGDVEPGVRGEERVLGQTDLAVELLPDPGPGQESVSLLSCRVDPRGGYRISPVPAGTYLLRVKNKFHVARVMVGEGEDVLHDIRLGGGRIFGQVTDRETGDPLREVQVVVQLSPAERGRSELRRRAGFGVMSDRLVPDEDGYYEFRHLPLGEYLLFSNGRKHAPSRASVSLTEEASAIRLDFALDKGSSVDIAITDLEGNPLESPLWLVGGIRCGFLGHVLGLRAGTSDFVAWAPGHEVQVRTGVVFRPGKPTELVFRLAPAAESALGFRDPEGKPVEGVRVEVRVGGRDIQPWLETFLREQNLPVRATDARGEVHVRGVKAGPVRIVAKKSGFALFDEVVELESDRTALTVTLEPADTEFLWRVRVVRVNAGSPAERIGLRPGDVIVSYGDREIDSIGAVPAAIRAAAASGADTVTLTVEREGRRFEVEIRTGPLGVNLEEFEE
jgi:hypothetical protein